MLLLLLLLLLLFVVVVVAAAAIVFVIEYIYKCSCNLCFYKFTYYNFFSLGFRLPPIHQQTSIVVNNIALRLKTITLNPFPTKNDRKIYESFQHHELLTLRSAQKYFIPSRSYVQPETVK